MSLRNNADLCSAHNSGLKWSHNKSWAILCPWCHFRHDVFRKNTIEVQCTPSVTKPEQRKKVSSESWRQRWTFTVPMAELTVSCFNGELFQLLRILTPSAVFPRKFSFKAFYINDSCLGSKLLMCSKIKQPDKHEGNYWSKVLVGIKRQN